MPLLVFDDVTIAYGHVPLLEEVSFQIEPHERVAVIGRNGSGKSTLLSLAAGEAPPDAGTIGRAPGTRVARLVQDVPLSSDRTVFDVVAEGLGGLRDLVSAYHRTAVAVSERGSDDRLERLGRLQHALEEKDGWRVEQRVELVLSRLGLPTEATVNMLSGGWRRRVLLARALVAEPDLLLLDEPTNHLDLDVIVWLEAFLADYPGAVMFVTHDRAFLQRLATRIVELDRGKLTSWPGDFTTFVRKKEEWLAAETQRRERFDQRLAVEEAWLRQGVKARRTRDEGRLRALMAMREMRAARRETTGQVRLRMEDADPSGRMVFEAEGLTKSFDGRPIVRDFTTRVMRGDRVGLIGPNGSGKTTLLRLLIGELTPDAGIVRRGTNVQVAYYDQQREQLNPERTVFDTVGDGNDAVIVNGRSRHVNGYLADFQFPRERAHSPVKALSGGERNRLLLARLFTRPANVLVLDEPTNDLDLETLELLEAQLAEFRGTLLLVSHDRVFLDRVVTSTFVLEGEGRVQEYVGGYEDWLRQRPGPADQSPPAGGPAMPAPADAAGRGTPASRKRPTFRELRELDELPARIESLEAELARLESAVGDPGFYREPADLIRTKLARLEEVQRELLAAYARWDDLDSRASR